MLSTSVRAAVKRIPVLYRAARMARAVVASVLEQAPVGKHELIRFRRYCVSVSKYVSDPVFIKVGANDGVTGDPCSDILLAEGCWRGVLVEPVPYCYERLRANFSDSTRYSIERVAIGKQCDRATFYYVDEKAKEVITDLPRWFDQLGSFNRRHIVEHLDGTLEPFIMEKTVEVCPLWAVMKRNEIEEVHLLHIDTEGHDLEVLKTVDFESAPPVAIFVEHKHLSEEANKGMRELFDRYGYTVRDCGSDYFAVNRMGVKRLKRRARGGGAAR